VPLDRPTIDQIVEAFIPEMAKISKTNESEEQKERHYKAWLRATLQKFADDMRKSQRLNKEEDPPDNDAASTVHRLTLKAPGPVWTPLSVASAEASWSDAGLRAPSACCTAVGPPRFWLCTSWGEAAPPCVA
jgi:hypothetical protein